MNLNSKKVLIISPYSETVLSFRGNLINDLMSRGFVVYLLSPELKEKIKKELLRFGAAPVNYYLDRKGMNPLKEIKTCFVLYKNIKRIKPDVVFSYNIKPVIYGSIISNIAKVPKIISMVEGLGYLYVDNQNDYKKKIIKKIVNFLYKIAFSKCDTVVFLNKDDMQEFITLGLIKENICFCLGGIGVDLNDFKPKPPVLSPVTFCLAARLIKEKGVYEYAEAAKTIKRKYPNTRFILLGKIESGPNAVSEEKLREFINEGILEWPGYATDIKKYLSEISVFVLPSFYREGVPRSIQEAMAMARPIITTNVPGCRETVIDGLNGFLVPPHDPNALTKAIEKFILGKDLIEKMGKESRLLAEKKFDIRLKNELLMRIIVGG